ncbi:MAG: N-formylglutamate deformylase [Acidiphilium sp.]|nr:N-formylglutamate deformylase [Acidiphilium sp.]MDD4935556.1 N-formylglutamate deformylase [Acidiphilium sp.]
MITGNDFLHIRRGSSRLLLSLPHTGTEIPDAIASRYVSRWQALADTDWWVEKLYDFAYAYDITIIRTAMSRSVIDVNRDPSGASLYPGIATTSLCPILDFDGNRLYKAECEPDNAEIERRLTDYFLPYHATVAAEIRRLRTIHDNIVLFDAHSIRSRIPRLFDGTLPICNFGTYDGASASSQLMDRLKGLCAARRFDHVLNGRFKGGYITRHYGTPANGIHAIQLELACRAYIDEPESCISPENWPPAYSTERAAQIRSLLIECIEICMTHSLLH